MRVSSLSKLEWSVTISAAMVAFFGVSVLSGCSRPPTNPVGASKRVASVTPADLRTRIAKANELVAIANDLVVFANQWGKDLSRNTDRAEREVRDAMFAHERAMQALDRAESYIQSNLPNVMEVFECSDYGASSSSPMRKVELLASSLRVSTALESARSQLGAARNGSTNGPALRQARANIAVALCQLPNLNEGLRNERDQVIRENLAELRPVLKTEPATADATVRCAIHTIRASDSEMRELYVLFLSIPMPATHFLVSQTGPSGDFPLPDEMQLLHRRLDLARLIRVQDKKQAIAQVKQYIADTIKYVDSTKPDALIVQGAPYAENLRRYNQRSATLGELCDASRFWEELEPGSNAPQMVDLAFRVSDEQEKVMKARMKSAHSARR